MSSGLAIGFAMEGPSPLMNSSFKPSGSTGRSRSAKMMAASTSRISTGCRVTVGGDLGFLANLEDAVFRTDVAIGLQIAPGLAHEPHWPDIGVAAPACL